MRLTLKQLQAEMQDLFAEMTIKIQGSAHGQDELNDRADRILLNLERFKTTVEDEFSDVRSEMRSEFADVRSEMRSEFADVRSEMRSGFADLNKKVGDLNVAFAELASAVSNAFARIDQRFDTLEETLVLSGLIEKR